MNEAFGTNDGLTYFAVVLAEPLVHLLFDAADRRFRLPCRCRDLFCAVATALLWLVGQSEVPAEHVDALLPPCEVGAFIGSSHRVHAGDTHRDIRVTDLSGGRPKPLHEAALLQISLPAIGHDQCHGAADTGHHGQGGLEHLNRRCPLARLCADGAADRPGHDQSEGETSQDGERYRGE
jgi:hypothetical protein